MDTITIKDREFKVFIPHEVIQQHVKAVAERINKDMEGRTPMILTVLKGSFMFVADLMRNITIPCEISFVKFSSYLGTANTGKVEAQIGVNDDISGRDIIIVEDIVDSGRTLEKMIGMLHAYNPKSIHICTLLHKPTNLEVDLDLEYVAITIPDKFVVGYGLDYYQLGRNLPHIYTVVE